MVLVNAGPKVEGYHHTSSHTGLVFGGTSSSTFSGRSPVRRPPNVAVERALDRSGLWLLASHDGYCREFGVTHERRLFLAPDGNDLRGEDTVTAQSTRNKSTLASKLRSWGGPIPFAVHFHIDPAIVAAEDDDGVYLTLPSGEAWAFRCSGGEAVLRSSTVSVGNTARDTVQIVIDSEMSDMSARVNWALRRADGLPRFPRDISAAL
jgi:uncharacterized heparinase superfamily protein